MTKLLGFNNLHAKMQHFVSFCLWIGIINLYIVIGKSLKYLCCENTVTIWVHCSGLLAGWWGGGIRPANIRTQLTPRDNHNVPISWTSSTEIKKKSFDKIKDFFVVIFGYISLDSITIFLLIFLQFPYLLSIILIFLVFFYCFSLLPL